jgi:hypothetical protein
LLGWAVLDASYRQAPPALAADGEAELLEAARASRAPSATGISLADFGLSPGDVVSEQNVERFSSLVTPGIEWGIRQGWRMRVIEPEAVVVPRSYREATEKYAAQVRLGRNGLVLENYVAGQPFPEIDPNDPQAALKVMWNYYHNFAVTDDVDARYFDADTGSVGKNEAIRVERHFLVDHYRKLFYTGRLYVDPKPELPNREDVRFKESVHPILEPFDMKGLGATFYRYLDPDKQDDSWVYVPELRRVRRLSTAQRSDSLFGQDTDADSYGGYNGHIAWMTYRLLGERTVLGSMHARNIPAKWQEPENWLFDDVWEPRPVWVIEAVSKLSSYAYGKRVLFIDKEAYLIPHSDIYDRSGELWKVWVNMYAVPKEDVSDNTGQGVFGAAVVMMDAQLAHATKTAIPSPHAAHQKSIFINMGEKSGTTEDFFTVAHLVAAGK